MNINIVYEDGDVTATINFETLIDIAELSDEQVDKIKQAINDKRSKS